MLQKDPRFEWQQIGIVDRMQDTKPTSIVHIPRTWYLRTQKPVGERPWTSVVRLHIRFIGFCRIECWMCSKTMSAKRSEHAPQLRRCFSSVASKCWVCVVATPGATSAPM